MPGRRFPTPWSVEEQDACFVVRDRGGQQLAYSYFDLYSRKNRSQAATAATKDLCAQYPPSSIRSTEP
jgi:Zn-dependent oligopeptidase